MILVSQYIMIMINLLFLSLLPLFLPLTALPSQAPIIGIYTQTDDSVQPSLPFPSPNPLPSLTSADYPSSPKTTYIAASYVKFVQLAGAQVVPIFAYSSKEEILSLLPKLNGVLFPGGGEDINISNKWTSNAQVILDYAMSQNDKGNVFPIFGTCLGMQLLFYLTSNYDGKAISPVHEELGIINTVRLTNEASDIFSGMPLDIKSRISKGSGIFYFNHHYAITTDYYISSMRLKEFWRVNGVTTTKQNEQFLSAAEGKKYPFYAVQFHPQKNLFEWKVYADRTDAGAEAAQLIANAFVGKARLSRNGFPSYDDFEKRSIYVYNATETTMSFSSIYEFRE